MDKGQRTSDKGRMTGQRPKDIGQRRGPWTVGLRRALFASVLCLWSFVLCAAPTGLSPSGGETVALLDDVQSNYLYTMSVDERSKVMSGSTTLKGFTKETFCVGTPVTLSWKDASGSCAVEVRKVADVRTVVASTTALDGAVAEAATVREGTVVWTATTSGSSTSVINLELDADYEWTVTDASGTSAPAKFHTAGEPPRLIKAGSMKMMRDLGGWTGALDGKEYKIRQNRIFRGGPPNDAKNSPERRLDDDAAHAFLVGRVGLKTQIDFRDGGTSENGNDPQFDEAVTYKNNYFYWYKLYGIDSGYSTTSAEGKSFVDTLKTILDSAQRPVYFHCTMGRDRTGTIAALTLALLGVSREDILRDFQTTTYLDRSNGTSSMTKILDEKLGKYKTGLTLAENTAAYFTEKLGITDAQIETFRKDMLIGYGEPEYWTEEPHYVVTTRTRLTAGKVTEEQYEGFETQKGFWYTWGKDGAEPTGWTQADGTPLKLAKPADANWKLMVRKGDGK